MSDRERDLVVRAERPFNAGTPMAALAEPVVPNRLFYVRSHFDVPEIDPQAWRLSVGGAVERPLELSLAELGDLPRREVAVTLECAGNGRTRMRPTPGGTPWDLDAVSTGRFAGASLGHVLDRAGVTDAVVEILFTGADRGEVEPGRTAAFERSLPVADASDPDTILAWEMNGEPLPPDHGRPVRLVVPRWYGVASVKWLERIEAIETPFEGFYQAEDYIYIGDPVAPDRAPVTTVRVRAVIARPEDGARLPAGSVEVAGTAWSGDAAVERVEVSVDGGATWAEAELGESAGPHAAVPWRWEWSPGGAGRHEVVARAADASGAVQPLAPLWNAQGYGNNGVQRVTVEVE
ncbi:MAG TPA: sulfite oxidase [Gemmatimonadota bacterium]|nr:sulfite oxidase [Gemmatimonadota bacterium]